MVWIKEQLGNGCLRCCQKISTKDRIDDDVTMIKDDKRKMGWSKDAAFGTMNSSNGRVIYGCKQVGTDFESKAKTK
jgi:hypothetical protein